jgi:hypothetical protein
MIEMQVRPTLPFTFGQVAKNAVRIRPPDLMRRDPFGKLEQFFFVSSKICGRRTLDFLIGFTGCFHTSRPRHRQVQRAVLHDHFLQAARGWHGHASFTQRGPQRIAPMTNRLMRRHLAPNSSTVRLERRETLQNFGFDFGLIEGFHSSVIPLSVRTFGLKARDDSILLLDVTEIIHTLEQAQFTKRIDLETVRFARLEADSL